MKRKSDGTNEDKRYFLNLIYEIFEQEYPNLSPKKMPEFLSNFFGITNQSRYSYAKEIRLRNDLDRNITSFSIRTIVLKKIIPTLIMRGYSISHILGKYLEIGKFKIINSKNFELADNNDDYITHTIMYFKKSLTNNLMRSNAILCCGSGEIEIILKNNAPDKLKEYKHLFKNHIPSLIDNMKIALGKPGGNSNKRLILLENNTENAKEYLSLNFLLRNTVLLNNDKKIDKLLSPINDNLLYTAIKSLIKKDCHVVCHKTSTRKFYKTKYGVNLTHDIICMGYLECIKMINQL